MKNYYFLLIENFIGIGYLILFLFGFFTNVSIFYNIGGIGMLIFMFIMTKEQPKNLFSLLFMGGIACIVAYFLTNWWLGLFWVGSLFTVAQLFEIKAVIKNTEHVRKMNFVLTRRDSDINEVELIELLFFIGLMIIPYLLSYYLN